MTDKQPEPLRLADVFDKEGYAVFTDDMRKAAAELRRLHAENSDFRATIDHLTRENAEQIGEIVVLKEQRDELLEALREVFSLDASLIRDIYGSEFVDRASAAIAKATGETK